MNASPEFRLKGVSVNRPALVTFDWKDRGGWSSATLEEPAGWARVWKTNWGWEVSMMKHYFEELFPRGDVFHSEQAAKAACEEAYARYLILNTRRKSQ